MKKSLTLLLVLFLGSTVHASVIKSNLGLNILASKAASVLTRDNKIDINLNDDLNLDKSLRLMKFMPVSVTTNCLLEAIISYLRTSQAQEFYAPDSMIPNKMEKLTKQSRQQRIIALNRVV